MTAPGSYGSLAVVFFAIASVAVYRVEEPAGAPATVAEVTRDGGVRPDVGHP